MNRYGRKKKENQTAMTSAVAVSAAAEDLITVAAMTAAEIEEDLEDKNKSNIQKLPA